MSWIEIVDTLVKVGLGAFISGVLAILLARQNQKAELQRDYVKRRQGLLDLFMEDFEPLHIEIYEHTGKVHSLLSTVDAGFSQDMEVGDEDNSTEQGIEGSLRYRAAKVLYKLQARLLYLNLQSVANLLNQYRLGVEELNSGLPDTQELIEAISAGNHSFNLDQMSQQASSLTQLRDKIYQELGKADRGELPI